MQSVIFRALSSILMGLVLLTFPAETVSVWLVRMIGALFMIPGLVSLATYFMSITKQDATRAFLPVLGVGSVLLGGMLLVVPETFVTILMYVLACILLLAGISSLINNMRIRKFSKVGISFYLVPMLICMVGIFIIINPWEALSIPFIVFGVASIFYGLSELVYAIHFRKVFKEISKKVNSENTAPTDSFEEVKEVDEVDKVDKVEES